MDIDEDTAAYVRSMRALNVVITCMVAAIVSTVAWWALLAWNANGTSVAPDGTIRGYPRPWQDIAALGVAGLLAIWCGHRRSIFAAPGVAALAVLISSGITFLTARYPFADPFAVIAAIFLGFYTFCGVTVVAALTKVAEDQLRLHRSTRRAAWVTISNRGQVP